MSFSRQDLEKTAHLARLFVSQDNLDVLANSLDRILALIDEMKAVDVANVPPMAHPRAQVQRLRPDGVTETNQRELFQSTAPAVAEGLYLVPKVIES